MLINKASLTAVFISLKTTFNKAFMAASSQWQETAMRVTSDSSQNDYSWLSNFPRMRKWIGDKVVRALEAFKYTIVNEDWEATLEVDRNDIKDDMLGIYGPQAEMAGYSAKQLPDEIVSELKNKGFENKCYDGQYFYDTDHPVDDGNGNTKSVSNTIVVIPATRAWLISTTGFWPAPGGYGHPALSPHTGLPVHK